MEKDMLTNKIRGSVAFSAAAILVLSGCATQTSSESSTASATTAAASCDINGNSQGITDTTITLGAFTPMTGPVADPGNGTLLGQQVAFDAINAAGGVQGRQIKFVTADDKYDPAEAQKAAIRLNEQDKVFAFAGSIGTPNFVAVLPYIKDQKIPSIGMYAPSNQVGIIDNPNVYMTWPNFKDEFKVSTKYLVDNLKPTKIAMIQMAGDVGDDALAGVQAALAGTSLTLAKVVTVEATTTDYSPMVQQLKATGADWVISINQPTGTGQVIQAAKKIGYNPRWVTQSDMTDGAWIAGFKDVSNGIVAATKVAALSGTDPDVQAFVKAFTAATGKAPTMWNAVGYVQSLITIEALKNAPALTRECLEYSLQNMNGFKTGLIPPVTFSATSRQGTSAVGVGEIKNGVVEQVAPFLPVS